MQAAELLLNTLDDLIDTDLGTFHFYLTLPALDQCTPFPKSHVDKISRHETVSKMIGRYGDKLAVDLTVAILKKMRFNNAAMTLEDAFTKGSKAAPSSNSSSAAAPPSTSGGISAQHGAVVINPVLHSGTTGAWNVTINK